MGKRFFLYVAFRVVVAQKAYGIFSKKICSKNFEKP